MQTIATTTPSDPVKPVPKTLANVPPAKSAAGKIPSESQMGGKTVIKSTVGSAPGRRGFDKLLPRGVELGY